MLKEHRYKQLLYFLIIEEKELLLKRVSSSIVLYFKNRYQNSIEKVKADSLEESRAQISIDVVNQRDDERFTDLSSSNYLR